MAPIHDAARKGDVAVLSGLLDGDPGLADAEDFGEQLPLHLAAMEGHVAAVGLLLDRGASVDKRGAHDATALMRACVSGRLAVVKLLLSRGADPTLVTSSGYTVLMGAANGRGRGSADGLAVVRLLLKDGRVAVDAQNRFGRTALWWACEEGAYEVARVLLLEGGADYTITSSSGTEPVTVAERMGHTECVRLLKWYDGEVKKAYLLSKARAVAVGRECIMRAAARWRARTEEEANGARQHEAPTYMKARVVNGQPLPDVEVMCVLPCKRNRGEGGEEVEAVSMFVMMGMPQELFVEFMQGLRYH